MKPDINITTVDARGIINEHPMDGALVSAGSLWQLRSKEGVALVYLASLYFWRPLWFQYHYLLLTITSQIYKSILKHKAKPIVNKLVDHYKVTSLI